MVANFLNKNKGFTLIELLVVVAIISLLSSIVFASLSTARAKGRDAKRLRDLTEIRTALELYRSDNGAYPNSGGAGQWKGTCSSWNTWPGPTPPAGAVGVTGATGYIPSLAPTYIPVLPVDPKPILPSGCYIYASNGTDYAFLVYGTVEGTVPVGLRRYTSTSVEKTYAIWTPGVVDSAGNGW